MGAKLLDSAACSAIFPKQGDQMFLLKNRPKTMKNSPKSRPTMFLLDLLYMENLMVIRVEVIAPEKPLISKHLQK
jgi:hypothetical protein